MAKPALLGASAWVANRRSHDKKPTTNGLSFDGVLNAISRRAFCLDPGEWRMTFCNSGGDTGRGIGANFFCNSFKTNDPLAPWKLARPLQRRRQIPNMMKKRHSSKSHEASAHPKLINYLALIHAVTHPGTRPDPGKRHRSPKSPVGAVAAG